MAFNLGAAFGGFAQGLSEGIPQGVQLAQKQQQIELQKAQQKLSILGAINNMKSWSPKMREQFGGPLLKQISKSMGVEVSPVMLEAFAKGDQALVNKMADFWATRVKGGANFKDLLLEMNDPIKIAEFGVKIESGDIRKATLDETKRYHSASIGLQAQGLRLQQEERIERRMEREGARVESAAKDIRDTYATRANPSDAGNFFSALSADEEFKKAVATRDTGAMRSAADRLAAKNPKWFREDAELPPISKLYRALDKARTPEERASIQGQIAEEEGKAQKAIAEGKRSSGDLKLLEAASKDLDKFVDRLMPKNEKGDVTVNRGLVNALGLNLPFSEGRQIRAAVRRTILDYVFARSGKQVAVGEIDRWMETYLPSPLDNDSTVRDKMNALRKNLDTLSGAPARRESEPAKPELPQSNTNSWNKSKSGLEYRRR